jgi:hypothetical protein
MTTRGVIYVATNRGMPNLVKLGSCAGESADSRLKQLSASTSVPFPFECRYAALVEDYQKVERKIHKIFDDNRPNKAREFFRVSAESIIEALQLIPHTEVTPGSDYALNANDKQAREEEELRQIQSGEDEDLQQIKRGHIDCVIAAINERESPGAFREVFLGENCWRSLVMSKPQRDAVKWLALYQVSPLQQVTHLAKVAKIVESKTKPGKWQLNFEAPPDALQRPIPHGGNPTPLVRSRRYCNKEKLLAAPSLTELFANR